MRGGLDEVEVVGVVVESLDVLARGSIGVEDSASLFFPFLSVERRMRNWLTHVYEIII